MTRQDSMKNHLECFIEEFGFLQVLDALQDICDYYADEAKEQQKPERALLWINRSAALMDVFRARSTP